MQSVLHKLQLGDDQIAIIATSVTTQFNFDPHQCLTRSPREHTVSRAVQQFNRLRCELLGQNIAADSLAVFVPPGAAQAAPARLDLAQAMARLRSHASTSRDGSSGVA
jgi:hypothetical protein